MSDNINVDEVKAKTEKDARTFGWVPREEFRGTDDEWADAETFVKRGREINPILRKNNDLLMKKLDQANLEIAEVKKVAKEFEKFQKETAERKVAEISSQLAALKQQKKDAISSGDGDVVVALDDQIDSLKADQAQAKTEAKKEPDTATPPATQALDPMVSKWVNENEWFGVDKRMTALANAIGTELYESSGGTLKGQAFFDKLNEELAEAFPEKLGKKSRPNPVEGNSQGSNRPAATGSKAYKNLPADAKQACDRFVKQGLMTQEQYVNDYVW